MGRRRKKEEAYARRDLTERKVFGGRENHSPPINFPPPNFSSSFFCNHGSTSRLSPMQGRGEQEVLLPCSWNGCSSRWTPCRFECGHLSNAICSHMILLKATSFFGCKLGSLAWSFCQEAWLLCEEKKNFWQKPKILENASHPSRRLPPMIGLGGRVDGGLLSLSFHFLSFPSKKKN